MLRTVWLTCFAGFTVLLLAGCASRASKVETYELRCKRIDHFMLDGLEVGVLEFEPCILPGGYIPIYHFPVYLGGEKNRDLYVNAYGSPDQMDAFEFETVSKSFLYQQQLLWVLEERTEDEPHEILKRYPAAPDYQQIKDDVIAVLSARR